MKKIICLLMVAGVIGYAANASTSGVKGQIHARTALIESI